VKGTIGSFSMLLILREIQLYLSERNYWKLLYASNRLFHNIRLNSGKIRLYERCCKKFIEDPPFAELILSKIKTPFRQFSLKSIFASGLSLSSLLQVPSCDLFCRCKELELVKNWQIIIDNRFEVVLMENSTFPKGLNIHTLRVSHFSQLNDVMPFSHLKELFLSNCNEVENVSCLSNLERVSIISCARIVDVNALGNIHSLHLNPRYFRINGQLFIHYSPLWEGSDGANCDECSSILYRLAICYLKERIFS
jgi:hypothetical protein